MIAVLKPTGQKYRHCHMYKEAAMRGLYGCSKPSIVLPTAQGVIVNGTVPPSLHQHARDQPEMVDRVRVSDDCFT